MAKPSSAEIHPGPGFRIRKSFKRPEPDLIKALGEFPTPDLSDLTNRLYALRSGIENLVNDESIAGPACTVKVYPGDNLMVHKALDIANPGDIIVVDTCGGRTNAVIGDMIAAKAKSRGIAGFVIDGLARDVEECREVGLPIFAAGTTPAGPLHRGPGEINYPVSCGGVVVSPGDIVIGDAMGVAIIHPDFATSLLSILQERREPMAKYVADVRKGIFSMEWVDVELGRHDCPIED